MRLHRKEKVKVAGIDLAGNPKNNTGFCIMTISGDQKTVSTIILHSDTEIIEKLAEEKPDLIAIDAPLTYTGTNRRCDEELREYGALPVTLRGMEVLAQRGTNLAPKLENKYIEVFSTGSGKILGFYDKKESLMQKRLLSEGITGDTEKRMLIKDEIDAIFAAMTAYLHLKGSTEKIGDVNEKIVIPKI